MTAIGSVSSVTTPPVVVPTPVATPAPASVPDTTDTAAAASQVTPPSVYTAVASVSTSNIRGAGVNAVV